MHVWTFEIGNHRADFLPAFALLGRKSDKSTTTRLNFKAVQQNLSQDEAPTWATYMRSDTKEKLRTSPDDMKVCRRIFAFPSTSSAPCLMTIAQDSSRSWSSSSNSSSRTCRKKVIELWTCRKKVIELWTCRKKVIKIFSAMCICEQSSLRFRKTYTWDQSQWKKQPRRKLVKGLLPDERYVHTARLLLSHASVFNITGTNKPWFVRIRSNERSSRELIRSPCPRWWARWTFQSIDALGKNATPFCRGRWDGNTLR